MAPWSHTSALGRLDPAEALAGNNIAPIALVTCDGGSNLYWNPHPGDNPMGMPINELIPLCHTRGLGTTPASVGAIGVSMGGYGAILLAEKHPTQIAAVAAISPAIWTSYTEAAHVNPVAYAIAQDFAQDNVPFHDGVLALARKLGSNATVDFSGGCHDTTYFASQQQRSLQFLAHHII